MFRYVWLGLAGPETDALSLEFVRDVDGAAEEFEPDLSAVGANQSGIMFLLRIEQIARAGLDDDAQLEFVEQLPEMDEIGGLGRERIAMIVVQRQGDAAVAAFGDQFECVLELMMRPAVGVVTETQIHCAQ